MKTILKMSDREFLNYLSLVNNINTLSDLEVGMKVITVNLEDSYIQKGLAGDKRDLGLNDVMYKAFIEKQKMRIVSINNADGYVELSNSYIYYPEYIEVVD